MIEIRLAEAAGGVVREDLVKDIFTAGFLLKRPLLEALTPRMAYRWIDDWIAPTSLEAYLSKCWRSTR